jgi:hypothetical protein
VESDTRPPLSTSTDQPASGRNAMTNTWTGTLAAGVANALSAQATQSVAATIRKPFIGRSSCPLSPQNTGHKLRNQTQ